MPRIFKSNAALSLGILVLGVGGLAVLIRLSPSKPQQGTEQLAPHTAPLISGQLPADLSPPKKDPFAERLLNPLTPKGSLPSASQNPATGLQVPIGIDPFKEKLSATSPFGVQR